MAASFGNRSATVTQPVTGAETVPEPRSVSLQTQPVLLNHDSTHQGRVAGLRLCSWNAEYRITEPSTSKHVQKTEASMIRSQKKCHVIEQIVEDI